MSVVVGSRLLSPDEALAAVLAHVPAPRAVRRSLADCAGYVLAESTRADRDYPPFDRAMMDGYGVRASDAGNAVRVAAEIPAGQTWDGTIRPGEAVEIMTGAPCPEGVELVVPVERARRSGEWVLLPSDLTPGRHIASRGSDAAAGEELLAAGAPVSPLAAAALAAVGADRPLVYARPHAAVITTGDELVASGKAPALHQLRDANGPLLRAVLQTVGVGCLTMLHAADDEAALRGALRRAAVADMVILTGGVSAGRRDLVPDCATAEGWRPVFHKVAQKPGKPLFLAERAGQLLFGLPGNPLAVHVCAHRYVAAAIRRFCGHSGQPAACRGALAHSLRVDGDRTLFCVARAEPGSDGWRLTPLRARSSADVLTTTSANALLRVEPGATHAENSQVTFEWLAGADR